jgi:PAS domain S-box-containing protein
MTKTEDKTDFEARPAWHVARRYGLALASVAAAIVLERIFLYLHLPQAFGLFAVSAIAITFWYSGTAPGVLAAILSSIVRDYYFEPQISTESRLLFDLVFLVFALLMTRVVKERNQLERRVAARTAELMRSNNDLKREIAERNQAEYLTGQVFESFPDAVLIIGTDYTYKRVNPVLARYWGKPAENIIGMSVTDLVGADFFEQRIQPFLDRCFAGEDIRFEEWFDNALGHRFVAVSYSPLRRGSEHVDAALVISRDLTDHALASEALRQAQADLAHANRMTTMGELTASLAHEVNQPIAAASTCASTCVLWLTRDEPDVAEAREAALGAVRNAKRAADIINGIRAISRKGESKRQPVDMPELIQEIVSLLGNEAQRYSIAVSAEFDADLPKVIADSVQVQQVMMNLIMNGIEAMKDADQPRQLVIRAEPAGDRQLMFTVSDTGIGLPQQTNKIFDAFFTTKPHGIGMGLRISRSIVESHGGRLWADGNPPRGASFYFTLPTQGNLKE